jgi:hypothetical protein
MSSTLRLTAEALFMNESSVNIHRQLLRSADVQGGLPATDWAWLGSAEPGLIGYGAENVRFSMVFVLIADWCGAGGEF